MYDAIIQQASVTWAVPTSWIKAVITVESAWKRLAYRFEPKLNEASYGLMQLLESTARGLGFTGDVNRLYEPEVNIDLGTKLLAELRQRYGDDFRAVYSAYNSGSATLWQTSAQVAANVQKALTALAQWAGGSAGSGAVVALLIAFLVVKR